MKPLRQRIEQMRQDRGDHNGAEERQRISNPALQQSGWQEQQHNRGISNPPYGAQAGERRLHKD